MKTYGTLENPLREGKFPKPTQFPPPEISQMTKKYEKCDIQNQTKQKAK